MSNINNILDELREWYGEAFDEALVRSLVSVDHQSRITSIGIISTYRYDNDRAQNNRALHELTQQVKKAGFGYIHVIGFEPEEECLQHDRSLLVIGAKDKDNNRLKSFLVKSGAKHSQPGVLYKSQGEQNAKFIHTSGTDYSREEDLGTWHAAGSAARYFSKLRDKKEGFSVLYLEPTGFFVRRNVLYGSR